MLTKSQEQNVDIFRKLDLFLRSQGIVCAEKQIFKYMDERKRSVAFDISRHIKGLIYSKLTPQQSWSVVEPKLAQVDKLFFNYDISQIKQKDGDYFASGIFRLKCGNMSTTRQMSNLRYNISMLELIDRTEGRIDYFYNSMPATRLVKTLSAYNGAYKLKYISSALAWEYLRNVGIDGIKPDVHIRRIMGSNRLGYSKRPEATDAEVISIAQEVASQTGLSLSMVDALLWSFCAEGEAKICVKNPNCHLCPIIKYCNIR